MGYHLEQAARFSRSRESTLNISDSVSYLCAYAYTCIYGTALR